MIITIIILLILAGVAIHFTLGENGILRNAETAGAKYSEASVKETIQNILADLQMEEIKNGRKLDLEKLAKNLALKDNNITLTEYEEGASELKGTYTINGQEYEFTINNKFEVEVKESTGEKIVKIKEIIWENGKPKVTLTSNQEGTIEYKDENGEWKPYNEDVNVKEGDTLTVRVKTGAGTTKEETIVIKDKTAPTEFTIEIASEFIKSKTVTVTLKTTPVDNETGLKDYTYVAETNGNKKEITNVTATSYKITELEPETSYTIYVLAYDNAGNYRKSNSISITTLASTPPIASVGEATHEAHNLDEGEYNYSWNEIEKVAKIISDDNRSTITYTTPEVNVEINGELYTLGVGDYKNVTYTEEDEEGNKSVQEYQVRILGFNHDTLATSKKNEDGTIAQISPQYGTGTSNTYAGISFEFVECLPKAKMNSKATNSGGWGDCELREMLNSTTYEKLGNNECIKQVVKKYISKYNDSNSVDSSVDFLWLLSCSEIFFDGDPKAAYGCSIGDEGEQYKYYEGASYRSKNTRLQKKLLSSSLVEWYLRSPLYCYPASFCYIDTVGSNPGNFHYDAKGVAPGFAI